MRPARSVTAEEFAVIAAGAGFRLGPEELDRMHRGFNGLQALLARLPDADPADEPAVIMAPEGARLVR